MSLAFLAKKSWHTANLRNVEKVWIAEQKHAAEEKKVEELRKNIEEERQLQELRQLQASQGDKAATQERLDWMYEGPSASREKSSEEYLLGKEYKEEGSGSAAAADAADLSTTTKYGSLAQSKAALPANDAFSRLNEDPMMVIRMRQKAARESVLKNPVKMSKIKAQVDKLRDDKKARKKARKVAKKERKHARREEKRRLKKKRKRDESSDDSDDSNDSALSDVNELEEKPRRPASASHHERRRSRSRERSSPRHGGPALDRRDRSPVDDRAAPRDVYRRSRSAPRGRSRTPTPRHDRQHHHRMPSRSRSPARRQKRDHQVWGRSSERQRKEVKRSAGSPARYLAGRHSRTPPRRERGTDRVDRHRERRSRSPVDTRGHQRRSRSPADAHRRQRRSRSPVNTRGHQRRSRSPADAHRRQRRSRSPVNTRGRVRDHSHQVSGEILTRQERGSRQSSSRDRHRSKWSIDDGRGSERDRRQESSSGRRKPLDTEGRYGLISYAGAVESKEVDKTSLGPNAKYLAKAREAKRQEEEERRRKLVKTSTSHGETGRPLTTEEKQRLAAQMVEDAKQRDEYITKRATRKKDELDEREQHATSDNPEFLQKMRSSAYLSGESSMGDRLRRNKHYIQKNADASNFLSK